MTEPHVLAVAASALLLFLASAALVAPRPVRLSGEEGFKRTLAHLLGGGSEAARAAIPWHPLGRLPERKLLANAAIDGAPLPGEEELAAELRRLPGASTRWAALRGGADALLDAPAPADDLPRRWLGPAASGWDAERLPREIERRLGARWAVIAGPPIEGLPDVASAFGAAIPWTVGERHPSAAIAAVAVARALHGGWPLDALIDLVRRAQDVTLACLVAGLSEALSGEGWLLLLVTGEAAPLALRLLHDDVALRDRALAVVSVGGAIHGHPDRLDWRSEAACRDWLEANFRHEALDVEVLRRVPYLSMAWLDPASPVPGAAGLPVSHARFPAPSFAGAGRFLEPKEPETVVPVDLGVLEPATAPPAATIAAALRAWAGLWALAQRG